MPPEAESLESILRLDSESQLSEQECNDAFRAQVTKWSPAPDELACDYWAKIARRRYQQLQIAHSVLRDPSLRDAYHRYPLLIRRVFGEPLSSVLVGCIPPAAEWYFLRPEKRSQVRLLKTRCARKTGRNVNVLWVIQIPYLFIEGGIQWVHGVIGRPTDWNSSDQSPPGYCSDIRFGLLDGKRNMMVDWLVEVARYWCLLNTTLHLAVDLLDRFLFTVSKFDLDKFEVLALSCLHRSRQTIAETKFAATDMMQPQT